MVTITFVEHDGTARAVNATAGLSLLDNAQAFKVPGIDGDCGGFAHAALATSMSKAAGSIAFPR